MELNVAGLPSASSERYGDDVYINTLLQTCSVLEGNRFYALDHIQNDAMTHSVALPTKTAICDILPDGVNGCVGPCHGSRR
jgi:hypothetical protein